MLNQKSGSGIAGDTLNTQLNTTANSTESIISLLAGPTFIFSLSEAVSLRMIQCLQDFFQIAPLGRDFNQKLWSVNKEVIIQDQFNTDSQALPQIVVTSVPVDSVPISLGNKLGREEYNGHLYDVYGGNANMATTLEIYDNGKVNVSKLADIVFLSLMQYVKESMQASQMFIQPQIRFTAAAKINASPVLGGAVYRIPLVVPVVSEWRQYMEIITVGTAGITTEPTVEH
jgi:hypothetical protein